MSALPNFKAMSEAEIVKWVGENDLTELMQSTERVTEPMQYVGPPPTMVRAAFRLPPETLDWLGKAAGRDREGKSGIVRRALAELRERHPELGSEAAA